MIKLIKSWSAVKKIIFAVFLIHFSWFIIFISINIWGINSSFPNLRQHLLIFAGVVTAILLLYFIGLRRIAIIKKAVTICTNIFLIAYASSFLWFIVCSFFNPLITLTQLSNLLQGNGLKRDYISLNQMSPYIKLAVIASEDQLYPDHNGFDLKSIKLAIKYNKKHPGRIRGASTISQQVAKNIFLWQGGGFLRKGPEVFFTFTIEQAWSKRTILERYLNIAEMGKGIFGVQAAAKTYFNKDAKDLTRAEAAQIAACLPNPKKFTVKPLSKYVAARYSFIMKQMSFLEPDPDIQALIK
ncbi:MAG: monofunctional biosynthetic peptidoglycan transglycosylase [Chitinophagaceae bacterium]|nr:monofunctional biosynthetic peptidoglycan transglycosylase [Chitinophagaceae bacterium]